MGLHESHKFYSSCTKFDIKSNLIMVENASEDMYSRGYCLLLNGMRRARRHLTKAGLSKFADDTQNMET